jgi:hypothetical protein
MRFPEQKEKGNGTSRSIKEKKGTEREKKNRIKET